MRIGVIGTGNMGGMLAKVSATRGGAHVVIYNRSPEKLVGLTEECPKLQVASSIPEVIKRSNVIIISTKAPDGFEIIRKWGALLVPSQVLITTISTVTNETWEAMTDAKVAKVIPSIAQSAHSGILLVSYGSRIDTCTREMLDGYFKTFATPFEIEEQQIRVASDLASCGPAFISYLLMQWSLSSAESGRIAPQEAEYLLSETVIGIAELLKSGMTLSDIVKRVAVPGGVTEAGLSALRIPARNLFCQLHETTLSHSHHGSHGAVNIEPDNTTTRTQK